MAEANSDPVSESHSTAKRSLPSWMTSTEDRNKSQKRRSDDSEIFPNKDKEDHTASSSDATQNNLDFSKLLEGVVFVLSGFVNPERSTLRAQALEMGAEYCPDWTSNCTLLICAFANTPKFRQVAMDCGTIVSKEWISECYNQKKLVDIEQYFMHAGKPWRRCTKQTQPNKGQRRALSEESQKRAGKESTVMTASAASEDGLSTSTKNHCLPSKIKEWAADDLSKTMSWLQNQDDRPQASEIRSVAAEGILVCLQDAMDSLKKKKDIKDATEQWMFVPQVVKYLAELDSGTHNDSLPKRELYELADSCKKIYENELMQLDCCRKNEKRKVVESHEQQHMVESHEEGFDSDQTIELTEEEIDLACKQLFL